MTYVRWSVSWGGWLLAALLMALLVQDSKPIPLESSCAWMIASTDQHFDKGHPTRRPPADLRRCAALLWAESEGGEPGG